MKNPTKDITTVAVMTALLICVQFALSGIAGVEIVTVLFVTFCVSHGVRKSLLTAVAFSLLRCMLFGTIVNVILLYLIHFCTVALFFGNLKNTWVCKFPIVIVFAVLATVSFTMLDNIISPIFYSVKFMPYFITSLPVMATQCVNVAITFAILFMPLKAVFTAIAKK